MLPFLKKDIVKMELLHNFSYGKKGMEFFGLANHKYLDKRLVIDAVTKDNIINQYREFNIDPAYDLRILQIEFGVDIHEKIEKAFPAPLKILYAGRGTAQKRIWLLNRIAEHFIQEQVPVEFTFAGSMGMELSRKVKKNCKIYHEIGDKEIMNSLYKEAHIIILTSAFEGFPLIIKEGMSFGCVPLASALPGIKTHLKSFENAILLENPENENLVVEQAIEYIQMLVEHPELLHDLSSKAYEYAKENFRKEEFLIRYKKLLED
jgi:glycosyltransferase involved in cell wall biosynthesis